MDMQQSFQQCSMKSPSRAGKSQIFLPNRQKSHLHTKMLACKIRKTRKLLYLLLCIPVFMYNRNKEEDSFTLNPWEKMQKAEQDKT